LTVVEARVLGCLLEKQRTVPDQYPLTLNALVSASNQSSSRDPIMQLSEHDVETAIGSLKTEGLVRLVHPSHGRSVTRYRQVADETWELESDAAALVAVLLLRGPQTVAELRTRTERQHAFGSLTEVQEALDALQQRELVCLLERRPGQKEQRWQQLLADEPAVAELPARAHALGDAGDPAHNAEVRVAGADPQMADDLAARMAELEARVAALEAALADLL
jgi:uncharacterized protein YceH (UPF0502 family)